ncbi:hypothetical protein cand_027660 [Cryptosporidium andersoni]|uniref:DUF676 domain-containing protein n=1 Tax=Cryptosporidium andersoni TaxID=117008 RepID=A0A1J4MR62_9CRYT|nr:hypothetical protein cand_027660 [Cryptosporidium andersoni]
MRFLLAKYSYKESPYSPHSQYEVLFLAISFILCVILSKLSYIYQKSNQQIITCTYPRHLIVMTHGWAGTPANMDVLANRITGKINYLNQSLIDSSNESCLLIHKVHSNWGYFRSIFITSDGIEKGAYRMANEIISVINHYPTLRKISFVGHSLGGMYNRAVLPLLADTIRDEKNKIILKNHYYYEVLKNNNYKYNHDEHLIAGLIPINYITFGTPHKGVLSDPCTFGFNFLQEILPLHWILLFPTIAQLLYLDHKLVISDDDKSHIFTPSVPILYEETRKYPNNVKTKEPLLQIMTNNFDLIDPLSWFKHRHAIGSIKGDLLVPPTSASLIPLCLYKNSQQLFLNFNQINKSDLIHYNISSIHPNMNKDKSVINWITIQQSRVNNLDIYRDNKNTEINNNLDTLNYFSLDTLNWTKTSVLFNSRFHQFFSHQLMMFCFENWGHFLLGNNFQLVDHIINNMEDI